MSSTMRTSGPASTSPCGSGDGVGTAVSSTRGDPGRAGGRPLPRSRRGARLLEAEPELEVAAVCDDLDSLLDAVDAERPDVVVTDIRMPPGNTDEGIQAAERLRETHPDVGRRRAQPVRDPELRARAPRSG